MTSDHTVHTLPYGASKGALDRIVTASAVELAGRGVRANVVNPGPIDTGWMDDATRHSGIDATPAGRVGTAEDTTDLVRFLFSGQGSWMNGQIPYSNGGFKVGWALTDRSPRLRRDRGGGLQQQGGPGA